MTANDRIAKIARAVLYEGYVLYPYRRTSLKNARPSMMGTLYPPTSDAVLRGMERASLRMECLFSPREGARLSVQLRFLQLVESESYNCMERTAEVQADVRELEGEGARHSYEFPTGDFAVSLIAEITVSAQRLPSGIDRLVVEAKNTTPIGSALEYAFHSAHIVTSIEDGAFVSLTDPLPAFSDAAAECRNVGVWPVLVGEPGGASTLLASPILLPDYPAVAPESPGDLNDASEIDEILTLRILTMTDEEKASARAMGGPARRIIDRTESLSSSALAALHGTFRGPTPDRETQWSAWDTSTRSTLDSMQVQERELRVGDRVTLRPKKRADILDLALEGRAATVAAIEQDMEDRVHVAVVVEDDPGRDLGELKKPGHRFFFSPDEVEPLCGSSEPEVLE